MNESRPCVVVVSPFVDKRHGTELCLAEWLTRFTTNFEVHLYSQRVEDIDLSQITWHRIPKLPGPHLLNYLWWFVVNQVRRAWDRRFCDLHPDLVFSPGINCLDAGVISVHIVFAEYLRHNSSRLRFKSQALRHWPQLLHRKLYYALIARLERLLYRNPMTTLVLVSRRIAPSLHAFFTRSDNYSVVHQGIDPDRFNPETRMLLREEARRELRLEPAEFSLLLVANDWGNKGLPTLLEALTRLRDLPIRLLVVGEDDPSPYRKLAAQNRLCDRVNFLPIRRDVEFYYAAADAYTGPSLEDAFGQPAAEAMACGIPIITAGSCGVSEMVSRREDGLILDDPSNPCELASFIRELYMQPILRENIGAKAAEKMRQFTWERSGRDMTEVLLQAIQKKNALAARPLRQEA